MQNHMVISFKHNRDNPWYVLIFSRRTMQLYIYWEKGEREKESARTQRSNFLLIFASEWHQKLSMGSGHFISWTCAMSWTTPVSWQWANWLRAGGDTCMHSCLSSFVNKQTRPTVSVALGASDCPSSFVNKHICRLASVTPVLNWANVCSPNILRTVRRTVIRFLIELLVRRTWFRQFEEFTCSQLACNEMQASARTCGRRAADSMIENVG